MFSKQIFSRLALLTVATCALLTAGAINAYGQNSTFTYQGRLTDSGTAANGLYDFEFRLFDANGAQIGPVVSREDVQVVKGVFTTTLDFGSQAFDGNDRSLEIAVRPGASTDALTTLAPRQAVTATPYSLRTLSAAKADAADNATMTTDSQKLGGIAAGQYVRTDDPRLVGGGPPAPGSPNYIQNGTTAQAASFNISGDGTAGGILTGNIVNAGTQFNIGGSRVVQATPGFTSVGIGAGSSTSGTSFNSFFGSKAGASSTSGIFNTFFGASSGTNVTFGNRNSFFGSNAGITVKSASDNTFVGDEAGVSLTDGDGNTFVGSSAGWNLTTGTNNTFIGRFAGGSSGIQNAAAIGANAKVSASNSLILGGPNVNVGVGTSAPKEKLQVEGGSIFISSPHQAIIFKSANGSCTALATDDHGSLFAFVVTCPK